MPTNIIVGLFDEIPRKHATLPRQPASLPQPPINTNNPVTTPVIFQPSSLSQVPTNIGVSLFNEDQSNQNRPDTTLQSVLEKVEPP